MTAVRAFARWIFEDRRTGRITVAQIPNSPLWVFTIASLVRRLAEPQSAVRTALDVVATGALVWWAVDELLRGVNLWRRALGAAVLLWQASRLAV